VYEVASSRVEFTALSLVEGDGQFGAGGEHPRNPTGKALLEELFAVSAHVWPVGNLRLETRSRVRVSLAEYIEQQDEPFGAPPLLPAACSDSKPAVQKRFST